MTLDGTEIIVECPNGRYTNAEVSVKTHVNQFPSAMLLAVWFAAYVHLTFSNAAIAADVMLCAHTLQDLTALLYTQKQVSKEDGELFGLWIVSASLRK